MGGGSGSKMREGGGCERDFWSLEKGLARGRRVGERGVRP